MLESVRDSLLAHLKGVAASALVISVVFSHGVCSAIEEEDFQEITEFLVGEVKESLENEDKSFSLEYRIGSVMGGAVSEDTYRVSQSELWLPISREVNSCYSLVMDDQQNQEKQEKVEYHEFLRKFVQKKVDKRGYSEWTVETEHRRSFTNIPTIIITFVRTE